jgi:hypothetical protein
MTEIVPSASLLSRNRPWVTMATSPPGRNLSPAPEKPERTLLELGASCVAAAVG